MMKKLTTIVLCLMMVFASAVALAEDGAGALYPARFGDKWGYINDRGEVVLEPIWGFSTYFRGDYALVGFPDPAVEPGFGYSDGIINKKGAYVVEPKYLADTGYDGMQYGGELGVIWLTDEEYMLGFFDIASGYFSGMVNDEEIFPWVNEGRLLPLCQNGLYGFIDRTNGDVVIPCQYEYRPDSFTEGFAYVPLGDADDEGNEPFMLIDEQNRPYTPPEGTELAHIAFYEGLIVVRDTATGLYGYADQQGALAIPAQFDGAEAFSEGYAAVKQNGLWGHIDRSGGWACEPRFAPETSENGYSFEGGMALLYGSDGSSTAIDERGETLFSMPGAYVGSFGGRAATLFTAQGLEIEGGYGPVGAIDRAGNVLFAPSDGYKFDYDNSDGFMDYFAEGYQVLVRDGKYGFVDEKGADAVPFVWYKAYNFRNGLAKVIDDSGKMAYIDYTGAVVWREP